MNKHILHNNGLKMNEIITICLILSQTASSLIFFYFIPSLFLAKDPLRLRINAGMIPNVILIN